MGGMIRRTLGTLVLALAARAPLAAQAPALPAHLGAPLALADVERVALDSNPGLVAFRREVLAARADLRTAGLRPNPGLSYFADLLHLGGSGGFSADSGQFGMTLALPLELGGRRGARVAVAERLVDATTLQVADSARKVLAAARLAWTDLLAASARLGVADEVLANYRRLVSLNRSRFQEQQIAGVELTRSELALQQAVIQRDEADLAVRQAQDALAALLGRRERVAAADTLAPAARDTLPLDSLVATALRDRPDLAAARAGRAAAEANVRLQAANAALLPTVGVDLLRQQGVGLAGLSGSLPLPAFNRNQGERDKAQVRVAQAGDVIGGVEVAVRTDVRAAATELATRRAALSRFDAASPDGILAQARRIRETAEFAYQRGSTSLLELLDAERTFAEILRSYIDAVAQYDRGLVLLDAATAADAARLLAAATPTP